MSVEIGQVIDGKYKVLRLVGEGGMGSVYEAEHIVIGRKVAVKVLHQQATEQQESVTRFEREAQAAARIGNDHILEVLDVGSLPDGGRYMVCEFLEGETLAGRLKEHRRLEPREIVPIARQLLNGLGAAHVAGVVHRDLKPDNIFLLRQKAGWSDFVKIIDFGISKFQALTGEAGMRMTATGIVMGTPFYLSPEQARGTHEADHRSDLYTVGVILYEAATGQLPFGATSFNDLLFKIVLETPKAPKELLPELDQSFSDLIMKGLARKPDDRFQSAEEFARALDEWADRAGLALTGPRVVGSSVRPSIGASGSLPAMGMMTPSTWGGTRPPQFSPAAETKPKRGALVAGLVGGGLLLVAGISYGIYAMAGSDHGTMATAPVDATASVTQPTPSAKPEQPAPALVDEPGASVAANRPDGGAQVDDGWEVEPPQPAEKAPVRRAVRPQQQTTAPAQRPKTSPPKPPATSTQQSGGRRLDY